MKIYRQIEFQMTSNGLEKVSEQSFNYSGPLSLAKQQKQVVPTSGPPRQLIPFLTGAAREASEAFKGAAPFEEQLRSLLQQPQIPLQDRLQASFSGIAPNILSQFSMRGRSGSGMEQAALGETFGNLALREFSNDRQRQLAEAEALSALPFRRVQSLAGILGPLAGAGQSSQQTFFRNPAAGAIGGGLSGAGLGLAAGGPIGGVLGGLGGLIGGLF